MPWQAPPVFVLGGLDDRFIRPDAVRGTATYYGATPHLVPQLAHALMLDPHWKDAAQPLLDWILRLQP